MNLALASDTNLSGFIIDVQGTELSRDEKNYLHMRLEWLQEKVPAQSCIQLKLRGEGRLIHGEISIDSLKTQFSSCCTGGSVLTVFRRMEKDVLKQIKEWRKNRFLNQQFVEQGFLKAHIPEEVSA